jgi:hypothetical protein
MPGKGELLRQPIAVLLAPPLPRALAAVIRPSLLAPNSGLPVGVVSPTRLSAMAPVCHRRNPASPRLAYRFLIMITSKWLALGRPIVF